MLRLWIAAMMLIGGGSYSLTPSPLKQRLCSDGLCVCASNGRVEATSKGFVDKTTAVGGVYQYSGPSSKSNDPPPELAALLGMKHKKSSYKSSRSQPSKTNDRPAGKLTIKGEESIDLLEKQVLSKYRSSSFKIGAEDEWDDEDIEELRGPTNRHTVKFHGFQPSRGLYTASKEDSADDGARSSVDGQNVDRLKHLKEGDASDTSYKNRSPKLSHRILERRAPSVGSASSALSLGVGDDGRVGIDYDSSDRGEQDDSWNEEDLQFLFAGRTKTVTKRPAETLSAPLSAKTSIMHMQASYASISKEPISSNARVDPQSVSSFRLRPPAPSDPAVQAKLKSKAAAIAEKEQLKQLRREKLLLESKSQFTPFEFPESGPSSTQSSSSDGGILTGASFRDLGIKDETILRNLDRLQLFSPTRIQALAIPALLSGRPAVLQAQTGSGKTLAFLLPLLAAVDPTRKQVSAICVRRFSCSV